MSYLAHARCGCGTAQDDGGASREDGAHADQIGEGARHRVRDGPHR
ncbi:hypothetical protein AB0K16_55655 [Nonomuraea jabiensis]